MPLSAKYQFRSTMSESSAWKAPQAAVIWLPASFSFTKRASDCRSAYTSYRSAMSYALACVYTRSHHSRTHANMSVLDAKSTHSQPDAK